ncbi:unnamed protein product, partial [Prorocentrum cordatum]
AVFRLVSSRGLDPSQGCVYINTSYTLLRADNNGCRRCPAAGPAPPAARDRRRRPDPEPPRGPGRRGPSSSGGQAKPPTGDEPAGRRGGVRRLGHDEQGWRHPVPEPCLQEGQEEGRRALLGRPCQPRGAALLWRGGPRVEPHLG